MEWAWKFYREGDFYMALQTGFICHESYFWHDTGNGALFLPAGGLVEADIHSENPATKRRVKNLLERTGYIKNLVCLDPREATVEEIQYYHSLPYINRVKEMSNGAGGDAGELAIVGKGSYEIALLSVGGALNAVDAVMQEKVQNVYALIRPPGHHAEKDKGMGFCLFNNVVIAAFYARKKYGLKRIMIVDWDVHHGNGTQNAFYADPNVLFVSLHQEGNFPPGSGLAEHVGEREGEGFNINIPLPAGTGNAGYLYVIEKIIEPIADQFEPELIIVSAGQDPGIFDPLARMMVTSEGFYEMATRIKKIAERHCQGKVVACHEGGYSSAYVPFCTLRVIEALSGVRSDVEDPFLIATYGMPVNVLQENHKEAVDRVINIQSKYWKFS